MFENYPKCRISISIILAFSPFFVLLKLNCLVTPVDRKLQVLKKSPKYTIFDKLKCGMRLFCDCQTLWHHHEIKNMYRWLFTKNFDVTEFRNSVQNGCWKVCIISEMMVSFQVLFCMLLLSCLYRAAASGVKAIWWDAKGDPWWPLFRVGRESKLPPDFTAHDSLHSSSCKKLAIRRSSHVTLLSYGLSTGNWGSKINRIFSRVFKRA